ncbi:MAG: hypothetical protein AAGD43_37375, partial [Pseudomonadota bacterium]
QLACNANAGRLGKSGQPIWAIASTRTRAFDRDLISGEHYGQRPCDVQHQQAGRMAAPTVTPTCRKTLPKPEPSTYGPNETSP